MNFKEKLQKLFESEEEHPYADIDGGEPCDVCKVRTVNAAQIDNEVLKTHIGTNKLNRRHTNTYRQRFEFMVTNNLWKLATRGDNLYMCLECFERKYLTSLIKNKRFLEQIKDKNIDKEGIVKFIDKLLSRTPNKYGFYQIDFNTDMDAGNPVNENLLELLALAAKLNKRDEEDTAAKKQAEKDRKMIGNYDYDQNVA
jgi:hypothetical protein